MWNLNYAVDERVAVIRFRDTEGHGLYTQELRQAMNGALQRFQADDEAWVAVVANDGHDFCLGSADEQGLSGNGRMALWGGGYVEVWKPTIVALQGTCRGEGLALALGCDLRVAAEDVRIEPAFAGQAEPDVTAAWLVNLVGLGKAFELLWLDASLSAREALSIGLVNRIAVDGQEEDPENEDGRLPMRPMPAEIAAPDGGTLDAACRLARELLQYAPVTRRFQKETALRSIGVPFAYAQTLELGPNPYGSEDRVEGTRAFVENRRPVWRNR